MVEAGESLESKLRKLSEIAGKQNNEEPQDPFIGIGGAVKWLSTTGSPEILCSLVRDNLPSEEALRRVGGFWAHLSVSRLESGLVVAEIHQEEKHGKIVYGREIVECRGVKDGSVDYGYPSKLSTLAVHDFRFGVKSGTLEVGSRSLRSTFTFGEKTIRAEGTSEDLDFSYNIAAAGLSQEYETVALPPLLKQLTARVKAARFEFKLAFDLSNECVYSCVLASGNASFHFGPDGVLSEVTVTSMDNGMTTERKEERNKWETVFGFYFPRGTRFPASVDVQASMARVINALSGSLSSYYNSHHENAPLGGLLVYRA